MCFLRHLRRQLQVREQRLLAHVTQSRKPHAEKANGSDLTWIEQQPPGHRDQRAGLGGRVGQRRRAGQRAHVGLLQLHRDRAGAATVAQQALMRVLGDRVDRFAQLLEAGQVDGEGGLGADLLGFGALGDGAVVDTAGQPVQRRPDGGAQDVGDLGVGQRGQLPDRLDAEPMQLLLGDRADAPQPPHRQPAEQQLFLGDAGPPERRRVWPGRTRSWRSACPSPRRPRRSGPSLRAPAAASPRRTPRRPRLTPRQVAAVHRSASSKDSCSTTGTTPRMVSNTRRLATPYTTPRGGNTTAVTPISRRA